MYPDLKLHQMYRLAYTLDRVELRGKPVVFLGWHDRQGDFRRARVKLLNDDEWLVHPLLVIPF